MIDYILNSLIAILLFVLFAPLMLIFFVIIKLTSEGPFIFKQKRAGKDKAIFTMYKVRAMIEDADKLKYKYIKYNEADGPAFKIYNDPRFTKIGKWLAHTGLDELPQLLNVIRGEMSIVGPRPLPLDEVERVPKKYHLRFSVLPGMTSLWVVKGAHKLKFNQWMELDLEYVKNKSVINDIKILVQTFDILLLKSITKRKNNF